MPSVTNLIAQKITKAVIPVAGSGSRLMPLTMHQPKALVGVADKTILHHLVEELANSGIKTIFIVHRPDQTAILNYVDYLKKYLLEEDVNVLLRTIIATQTKSSIDSLLYAEKFINNQPFLLCFGDDLMDHKTVIPSKAMLEIFNDIQRPVIALRKVPKAKVGFYGICKVKKINKDLFRINDLVEKPAFDKAPSNFAGVGRYILPSGIFNYCRLAKKLFDNKKEVSIVDVLVQYLKKGHEVYGWLFNGQYFDGGSHVGLLKAQIHYGLKHPVFGKEIKKFLGEIREA